MSAQRDLDRRREPPQGPLLVATVDKRGLRQVHLRRDMLHPCVIHLRAVEKTDGRRVAAERRVGEGINLKKSHLDIIPQFSKGWSVKHFLIAFSTVLVAAATVAAQRGLQSDPGADVAKGIPSATGRESSGGVEFINRGTPVLSDAELNSQPVPRLPDGHIDLTGPWVGGGTIADIERDGGLKPGELPLLPWAKELRDKRNSKDDPYTACLPMAVLRTNPYPWKFVMGYTSKGLTHIYILHELMDDGAHRGVYMDGRKHPAAPIPTWLGHSIGRWDGDALVADTGGLNHKFLFDRRGT